MLNNDKKEPGAPGGVIIVMIAIWGGFLILFINQYWHKLPDVFSAFRGDPFWGPIIRFLW